MKHKELAEQVMEMLLDGDDEVLALLKKQFEHAQIISEESDSAGFFINYQVNDFAIPAEQYHTTFQLGDVDGIVNDIEGAIGFALFVKNGFLTMLEGYTCAVDNWPELDTEIILHYDAGTDRNYTLLKEKWIK